MDDINCVICYSKKASKIYKPCNHFCICDECHNNKDNNMEKCPLCRKNIEKVLDIHKYFKVDEKYIQNLVNNKIKKIVNDTFNFEYNNYKVKEIFKKKMNTALIYKLNKILDKLFDEYINNYKIKIFKLIDDNVKDNEFEPFLIKSLMKLLNEKYENNNIINNNSDSDSDSYFNSNNSINYHNYSGNSIPLY